MKKIFLTLFVAMLGLSSINAQTGELELETNIHLPTGDASDLYSFGLSSGANYMFTVAPDFEVGPGLKISYFFGKDVDGYGKVDDAVTIPISVMGRYNIDDFAMALDIGYGIGISPDGNDGGFYLRPGVSYAVTENTRVQLTYNHMGVDGASFSSIGFGAVFGL